MKQIIFKTLAAALIGLTTLVSCKKEPIPQIGTTEVTFSFRINEPGTDANSTKSAISSDEEALKVIHVAFYNSSNGQWEASSVFTANSFTMAPVPNVNCDVLVMANLESDDFEWPKTLSEAMAIEKTVSVESINSAGIPMAGKSSWSAGTTSVTVGLDRLVSRYDVTANKTFSYGTWQLTSVTFSNAATSVTPFKANSSPSSKGTFDYATSTDVSNLNGGSVASFYLPEMIGSTAQIKIEGEWTATGMKRTASYELGVGSDNNKRNMKYQVKLTADSSNPVWSVTIGDDQLNNRFVYAGANPLVVTTNGSAATTTLTASSSDLQYRLETASSTADYATAALSFSTDGTTWHSYTDLPNLSFSGSVPTLYVKSGYTGSSVIDVPFRYVSADGKVLPAAANQSADGNTLNVKVSPMVHINSVTFKLVNKNSSKFKYAEITELDENLVGNNPIRFGNAIKLPYSKDLAVFAFNLNLPTMDNANIINVWVKINGTPVNTPIGDSYDSIYSTEGSEWKIPMVGNDYGADPVIEITFEEENGGGAASFNEYPTYGYYEECSLNSTYTKTVNSSLTPSYCGPLTVSLTGGTLSYKVKSSTDAFGQIWLTDNAGHYCHTILVKGTALANPPISNVIMTLDNNTATQSLKSDINYIMVNDVKYEGELVTTYNHIINSTLNKDITGFFNLYRSDSFDGNSKIVVTVGSEQNSTTATEIVNDSVAWSGNTSEGISYTITKEQVQAVGQKVYIKIKVTDE